MRYLIDGYNVFFRTRGVKFPLEMSRNAFIEALYESLSNRNIRGTVVFDSDPKESAYYPQRTFSKDLEIIFSPMNQTADDYILEHLSTNRSEQITLVTSDRHLAMESKELGANIVSVKEFFHLLSKEHFQAEESPQKPVEEDRYSFERLLKIFEDRYNKGAD